MQINHLIEKIIFIIFLIMLKNYGRSLIHSGKNINKNIFTFWEPRNNIPGYLKLCIKTWKKFLPEYEIYILDYEKAKKIIGDFIFSKIICKNMPLALQSDAIRVAILKKYGGIWLDTDTIILKGNFIKKLKNFELAMIGEEKRKIQYMGFIFASKESSLLNEWQNKIIKRVEIYKHLNLTKNNNSKISILYLGNEIINPILRNITKKIYFRFDSSRVNAFPERNFYKNSSLNVIQQYEYFYFQKRDPNILIKKNVDIILLHNSWTPLKYKLMKEEEFLNQDILLSKLLSKILFNK